MDSIFTKLRLLLAVILGVALLAALGISGFFEYRYVMANRYMENEQYEKAYTAFQKIPQFRDSEELAVESYYKMANACMQTEEYDSAEYYFLQLGEYKDSKDLFKEAYYRKAGKWLQEEQYSSAAYAYKNLKDYKDSRELYYSVFYEHGVKDLHDQKYSSAVDNFRQAENYKNSQTLLEKACVELGNEYLENKKYDDAIEAYSWIEDEQLRNRKINGVNYVHGMNLYNTKQYDLAIKQFKKCGEYRDAPVYVKRDERYQLAISTMENHQFAKAADMFVDLEDYRASASYLKEMKSKCSEYVTDTGDETRVRGFGEDLAKEAAVKANEALGNTLWTMTLYKDLEEITGESDGRYDASKIHDYIIENLDSQTMTGMIDLMALGDTSRYTNGEELGHGKEVYTEIGNAMWKISQELKKHDTVTDDEILDIYEKDFRTCLDQMRAWLDELK